jgi:uncharacterized protein (DUF924 family)
MDSDNHTYEEGLYDLFMFWYGFRKIRKNVRNYKCTESVLRKQWDDIWFCKTKHIDCSIRTKFGHLIPALIEYCPMNVYEKVGKMLLYDQVVRNVFRNTPEAYKYDDIARQLAYELLNDNDYISYPMFLKISIILTLIHSEDLKDHDVVTIELGRLMTLYPDECAGVVKTLNEIAKRHRVRIEMFGRLPERAHIKNLKLSPIEQLFLSNLTNLVK